MGIYLPNMEMPKSCEACELAKHFDGYQENDCPFNAFSYYDCPLIPVPPHGRLIDADALCECRVSNDNVVICAKCAPTVIPASKEG